MGGGGGVGGRVLMDCIGQGEVYVCGGHVLMDCIGQGEGGGVSSWTVLDKVRGGGGRVLMDCIGQGEVYVCGGRVWGACPSLSH